MAAIVRNSSLGLRGRCVKSVSRDEAGEDLVAQCRRDARFVPVEYCTGARGTVNRRLRRRVRDLPLWGRPVTLDRTPDEVWTTDITYIRTWQG